MLEGTATGLLAIDSTGQGRTDLLAWSPRGITLYRDGTHARHGFRPRRGDRRHFGGAQAISITTASWTSASSPRAVRCCIANSKGHFSRVDAHLPSQRFERAVWIDYDHDYDLDLILLGASSALYRNEGAAGFADRTADFPFVQAARHGG